VSLPEFIGQFTDTVDCDGAVSIWSSELGADWIALSFVQRAEDILEARGLMGRRAQIMAKLEKPAAIDNLDAIVALADGIMVARGNLGVELPPAQVPVIPRRMTRLAREAALAGDFGKPGDNIVIVAGIPYGESGTTNLLRIAALPNASL
jgi:pyruvate kinase